jgi:hypothetical protein
MPGNAQAADEPGHQRKACHEQDERAERIRGTQQVLAGNAQGDGGGEPDDQAGAKKTHVHHMNLNSYSHTVPPRASAKSRAPFPTGGCGMC